MSPAVLSGFTVELPTMEIMLDLRFEHWLVLLELLTLGLLWVLDLTLGFRTLGTFDPF